MRGKIKHVSLFSGIGAFEKPIKEVLEKSGKDYELVAFSEIDKWAVTSYCAIHEVDEKKNMGDISKINPKEVPDCDLITHGSPCFRAGTLITTDKGLKEIEDIGKGDFVLTHKNRFRKVVKPMITKANKIYELKVQGSPITYVTHEHPYYVRESIANKELSNPIWKEVKDLQLSDYVGEFINDDIVIREGDIVIDGILWKPFLSKKEIDTDEYVYNFEVEEDNSYVANNLIVHNCQDFSVAGKGEGGNLEDGTRSSLMWYTVNIVKHKKPKYVIWENVKGVLSKNHKHNFENYLKELEMLEYNNYYKVLNAKNYGIPQNRERIFVVSIRKDIDDKAFEFPEPFDNGIRLRHLLEDYVDEKYYISSERSEKLLDELKEKELEETNKVLNKNQDISYCIDANYHKGTTISDFLKRSRRQLVAVPENNIIQINNPNHFSARVYSKEGIAPTISAGNNGGGKEPCKILEEPEIRACISPDKLEVRQNGRRFKENDEPMFTLTAQDRHGIIKKENNNNLKAVEHNPNELLNIGMLEMKGSEQVRRVYDPEGLCPTLDTMGGGQREPKIVERNELKFVGGITDKDWAGDGKKLSRNIPQGERVYDEDGIACSQTANGGGTGSYTGLYLERPKVVIDKSIAPSVAKNFEREKEEIGETTKDIYRCDCTTGWQDHQIGINISPTLRASNSHTSARDNNYRVRKLTPLECWRLMGFSDEDYYKAKKALMDTYYNGKDRTNSQMYKQAGNSIVVNVLKEIYEKLFNN